MSAILIFISFCESKIDDIDSVAFLSSSDHEVIRFNVPMEEALPMNRLQPTNYLQSDVIDCCS